MFIITTLLTAVSIFAGPSQNAHYYFVTDNFASYKLDFINNATYSQYVDSNSPMYMHVHEDGIDYDVNFYFTVDNNEVYSFNIEYSYSDSLKNNLVILKPHLVIGNILDHTFDDVRMYTYTSTQPNQIYAFGDDAQYNILPTDTIPSGSYLEFYVELYPSDVLVETEGNINYQWIYNNGFRDGSVVGYNEGNQEGIQEGYAAGKEDGYTEAMAEFAEDGNVAVIFTNILNIALLPVNVFLSMLNFEFLGINISGFVSGLLSVAVVIIIIKTIIGNSSGGGSSD